MALSLTVKMTSYALFVCLYILSIVRRAVCITDADNLDPASDLNALDQNSLFTRWRPSYHFIAPSGWMNDPCAPIYDPITDRYLLSYQSHPNHVDWGNISWGLATSEDLVTWFDLGGWENDQFTAIGTGPVGSPDHLGIFSGSAHSVNMQGEVNGTLLAFYTSVSHLPIGAPYFSGAETQSLAYSNDGGTTWVKYANNPVITTPPWTPDVLTGFRDPYFERWPSMDALLTPGEEPHYYAMFGSGMRDGPRLPLYSAPVNDLTNWTFLGSLVEYPKNSLYSEWSAPYGYNFEVAGAFFLVEKEENGGDGQTEHFFIMMGAQGASIPRHPDFSASLWELGSIARRDNGSAAFTANASGWADNGNLYALMTFNDTKHDRRVQWGWTAEDNNGYANKQVGWQGSLGIPRELFVHVAKNVVDVNNIITSKGSWIASEDGTGTYTVKTMGIRPLPDVIAGIQANATVHSFADIAISNSTLDVLKSNDGPIQSNRFELQFSLANTTGIVGFAIRSSPAMEEFTVVTWDPSTYTVAVNRTKSSLISQYRKTLVVGSFVPYTFLINNTIETEFVNFRVFVDNSIIEVYVNERFALTTRVYPSRADALQIAPYSCGPSNASMTGIRVITGLGNVFPERPLNSSSRLIVDTAMETNNGQWWSGN